MDKMMLSNLELPAFYKFEQKLGMFGKKNFITKITNMESLVLTDSFI